MKRRIYISILILTTLLFGCRIDDVPERKCVKVDLRGEMQTPASKLRTRGGGEGRIDPIAGLLPPWQLTIGIVTIELEGETEVLDPKEWNTETAYLDPGFFGGDFIGDKPENYIETGDPENQGLISDEWTGLIKYINLTLDAEQQVFYNESGIWYYLMCIYPYDEDNIFNEVSNGVEIGDEGAWVYFNVDGSQDIMASTMGSGNIEKPFKKALEFSHKLTALRCNFIAESDLAVELYGDIESVELLEQPSMLQLNVGESVRGLSGLTVAPFSTDTSYIAVRDTLEDGSPMPLELLSLETDPDAKAVEFGYFLAMSAGRYTFKIVTSERGEHNPLYVTYDFGSSEEDFPKAGTIYSLTFKMLETAEILLEAGDPENWYFEQQYD